MCLGCRDPVRSLKAETASARRTFLRFAPPEVRYEEKRFLKVFRECEHGARTTSRGRRVSGSARWTIRILCVQSSRVDPHPVSHPEMCVAVVTFITRDSDAIFRPPWQR